MWYFYVHTVLFPAGKSSFNTESFHSVVLCGWSVPLWYLLLPYLSSLNVVYVSPVDKDGALKTLTSINASNVVLSIFIYIYKPHKLGTYLGPLI